MPEHVYPTVLKKEDWQKKKGILAKMAGKTGVGDAMEALQQAYEKTNWEIFEISNVNNLVPRGGEAQGLKVLAKNVQAEYKVNVQGGVAPALTELRKKATKAKADFEKSKVIPKKAGEHAAKVLAALDEMEQEIDDKVLAEKVIKAITQELEDLAAREKIRKDNLARLKRYVTNVAKDMKTVKTVEKFANPCWNENIRGVGTILPHLKQQLDLEEEYVQWRPFIIDRFLPKSDDEVPAKFDEIRPVLKSIAAKLV